MPELNSTVSVLPSSTAVQAVRGQLDAAGIESAVLEADGEFRLQVSENDFTRAMQLLFPIPTAPQLAALEAPGVRPWKCAHCGEEVQPVSDVCWACGKARDGAPAEAATSMPVVAAAPPPVSPPPVSSPATTPPAFSPPAAAGPTAVPKMAAAQPTAAAGRPTASEKPEAQESLAAAPSTPAANDAAPIDAPRRKRSSREPTIEEPNPWRDPWLIGLWVLIGISICVIAWLALR